MPDNVELLGLVAGVISTGAALPQLIKIVRTRSAGDVSMVMFVMALCGALLWLAYGVLKPAPSIVFWNVVGAVQIAAILAAKLYHDHKARSEGM